MNLIMFKVKTFFQRILDRLFGVKYPKLPYLIFRKESFYKLYDELQELGYSTQVNDVIIEVHEECRPGTDDVVKAWSLIRLTKYIPVLGSIGYYDGNNLCLRND